MSGPVEEQTATRDRDDAAAGTAAAPRAGAHPAAGRTDRWAWQRRVRANPHQRRVYRAVVGAVGTFLILLGLATGWLPGPGGIPLVLLGLAVLASEFHWAHRLMLRFKHALHVFRGWNRRRQLGFWLLVVVVCALLGWAYLAVLGPPAWIPVQVDRVLAVLPGVDIPA